MHKEKEHLSFEEVLSKLMKYCSYQERSEWEVFQKAKNFGTDDKEYDKLLKILKDERFIDNVRFAEVYTRGKVNQKKWGKYKIIKGLKSKGIKQSLITKAIETIDQEVYYKNLTSLIDKRRGNKKIDKSQKAKIYRYLVAKGYESNLIFELLD